MECQNGAHTVELAWTFIRFLFPKMRLILQLHVALASTSYLFQWETRSNNTVDCVSPPDLVYQYTVSDPTSTTPGANESWPWIANNASPFYPHRSCGSYRGTSMTDLCCASVLVPGLVANISAFLQTSVEVLPSNPETLFPAFMNGQEYCKLSNLNGALKYKELYIKPNNECYEQYLKCSNGVLSIYTSPGCGGSTLASVITATTATYIHPVGGTFQGKLVKITSGASKVGWTQMLPQQYLAINNSEPSEILATIVYATLLVTFLTRWLKFVCYRTLALDTTNCERLADSSSLLLTCFG